MNKSFIRPFISLTLKPTPDGNFLEGNFSVEHEEFERDLKHDGGPPSKPEGKGAGPAGARNAFGLTCFSN